MKIFPKEDIKNGFDQIMWYKNKSYECTQIEENRDLWVITSELIANEYPLLKMNEILLRFYTIEDQRDMRIDDVLK